MPTVRDVMDRIVVPPETISRAMDIGAVIRALTADHRTRTLIVTDDTGAMVGIVTLRELMKYAEVRSGRSKMTVHEILRLENAKVAGDVMLPSRSVAPDDDLSEAVRLMIDHNLDELPVVEGGKVIGKVSSLNMVQVFAEDAERQGGPG